MRLYALSQPLATSIRSDCTCSPLRLTRAATLQINRHVLPAFYQVLQAQDAAAQAAHAGALRVQLAKLVAAANATGPFFCGAGLSFVDVQLAPWLLRLRRVLVPYRGWPGPHQPAGAPSEADDDDAAAAGVLASPRWNAWVDAVEAHDAVRRTTSDDQLYLDSYQRYAENRPGTSQVADAINAGKGLP